MIDSMKIIKKILIVLLGILISAAGAMIWVNGGYQKDGLMQLGEVYEVPQESLAADGFIYDSESGSFQVQPGGSMFYADISAADGTWKYLVVTLKDMNVSAIQWGIDFCDSRGKTLSGKNYLVYSGKNRIEIPAVDEVAAVRISIEYQIGSAFRIEGMELREKYFDTEDFLKKAVVIFLICMVVYILISKGSRTDWYILIDILQNIYIWLGDAWGRRLASLLIEKNRKRLRVFCFTVMFVLMVLMDINCGWNYYQNGRLWLFGYGILLIAAGLLSWKEPLKKLNWRNPFCFVWHVLWGMVCLSDLFVTKSFSYVGYIMILCGGFAFFIWHNAGEFQRVLFDMLRGLEWTLPGMVIYCVLFRQKKVGVFYNGGFLQHENMAMYALALILAFAVELNLLMRRRKLYMGKVFVNGIGLVVSGFLLYYSRTRWCVVAAAAVMAVWILAQLLQFSDIRKKGYRLLLVCVLAAFCGGIVTVGIKYGVKTLPEKLETSIIYTNEIQKTKLSEDMMYALEVEQPGWSAGVVRETEEEKDEVRSQYIQKLNLIGNRDNLRMEGYYQNPFNGLLQMAHRYGMFVLAPYLLILLWCIYSAIRGKSFLWQVTVLACMIVLLFENLELPFTQPLWLVLYLGLGRFFGAKTGEENSGQSAK